MKAEALPLSSPQLPTNQSVEESSVDTMARLEMLEMVFRHAFTVYFSNTLTYEAKTGVSSIELDESDSYWKLNLMREALEITPVDQAYQFVSPLSGEAIMDFVNELGYTETSGHDRPRYPVLQMLWGIITSSNVDYAELMWEEFIQAIQTFLTAKVNLGSLKKEGREEDEVFRMLVPNELILNNIRNASYYNAYLKMVAKHDQKVAAEKEGKKKFASTKQPKRKPAIEKSSKPALASKPKLVDEPDKEPAHSKHVPEPEQEGAGEEYDMERAIQMGLELFQAQGHAYVGGVSIQEPVAEAI
ncbi:hypothetical protein Tco_0817104 [Tanacetum coccineum]